MCYIYLYVFGINAPTHSTTTHPHEFTDCNSVTEFDSTSIRCVGFGTLNCLRAFIIRRRENIGFARLRSSLFHSVSVELSSISLYTCPRYVVSVLLFVTTFRLWYIEYRYTDIAWIYCGHVIMWLPCRVISLSGISFI